MTFFYYHIMTRGQNRHQKQLWEENQMVLLVQRARIPSFIIDEGKWNFDNN
jgi:hypothetical protein